MGQGLTREKLLEIFIEAPSDDRLKALVSLTRSGLDYNFFQILTARIEKASGEERAKLEGLRDKVLDFTNQIDKAMEEQMKQADAFIEELLAAPNIAEATAQNIGSFNEAVVQVLEAKLQEANRKQDSARLNKLQQMVAVLQQANTPPELTFINALLEFADDDVQLMQVLKENEEQISEEMPGMIGSLMNQVESQPEQNAESKEIMRRLEKVYRAVLKFTMKKNM